MRSAGNPLFRMSRSKARYGSPFVRARKSPGGSNVSMPEEQDVHVRAGCALPQEVAKPFEFPGWGAIAGRIGVDNCAMGHMTSNCAPYGAQGQMPVARISECKSACGGSCPRKSANSPSSCCAASANRAAGSRASARVETTRIRAPACRGPGETRSTLAESRPPARQVKSDAYPRAAGGTVGVTDRAFRRDLFGAEHVSHL